jgi:hypothetical protein
MKFLGIFVAEGTVLKEERKIQIAACKQREKTFIREVLSELNQHYLELPDRFTITNKQLYTELERLGFKGIKAPQKFVPDFIFKLTKENMSNFLLGHFMGDGCEQNGLKSYYTSSKTLSDGLHRLLVISGEWGTVSIRSPRTSIMKDGRIVKGRFPEHRVSQWKTTELSIQRKYQVVVNPYDGEVFCAEVPTYHTLITRRNGKVLISGNCTSQAAAGAFQLLQLQQLRANLPLNVSPEEFANIYTPASRLFVYYNERAIEGTVNEDSGGELRDVVKAMAQSGMCPETMYPYDIAKFTEKPSDEAYKAAAQHKISQYASVLSLDDIKHALASGYPVVFGIQIYDSFESEAVAKTGIIPIPNVDAEGYQGGHAVCAIGYTTDSLIVRNSWGTSWGSSGYFFLPYGFVTNPNLSEDFWVIKK